MENKLEMVCVYMVAKDSMLFNNKLDKIQDGVTKLMVTTARLEEHQKSINGSVIRLQQESNDRVNTFKELDKRIDENRGSIIFAKGTVYAIGLLSTVIGLVSLTKIFGVW